MDSLINKVYLKILIILFFCIGCTTSSLSSVTTVTIQDIKGKFSFCVIDKKDGHLRRIFTNNKSLGIVYQGSVSDRPVIHTTSKGKNILWEMTSEGIKLKKLYESKSNIFYPVLSPDKKRITFIQNNKIWMMEIKSKKLREIATLPSNAVYSYGLNFSPIGNKLAFIGGEKSPFESNLWVVDWSNGKLMQLTYENNIGFHDNSFPLSWSNEGNNIAIVQVLEDGREHIGIVNVDTKMVKYLPAGISIEPCCPVWSPKGDDLIFVGHNEQESSNLFSQLFLNGELKYAYAPIPEWNDIDIGGITIVSGINYSF
ncbi:hypothetical protein COX18_02820 [Candidatus Desantisbacteria bacterium CG23_combo_of_CG06-09_8_20_14_all_40_23]|uniref:Dipeptidylpeptidase IV N-terminal domain-containing protein n=1 Tax=Candidatus Desantisbacteria bacterium CG23_combo_of_CG06-09_8_20_14_all_40_23 TaxID=1974550 RepID=A0A2H0A8C4_9BACT|nr:MAG: hypothetical protein COX18_02820 [Candidatus Desantisbacteria bacterium CG23_combo_of_CG06-09_8_20_14_all_40_23]